MTKHDALKGALGRSRWPFVLAGLPVLASFVSDALTAVLACLLAPVMALAIAGTIRDADRSTLRWFRVLLAYAAVLATACAVATGIAGVGIWFAAVPGAVGVTCAAALVLLART
jgi:hypothetical protein